MDENDTLRIDRVNELSRLARAAWLSLLGYLLFVGVTLLGVQDADFFLPSRQTRLPLVGVDIPTASFFWTAPVLGAALYIYLHLFLIKLWDAHADARTTDSDPTHHWLVGDFVLIRQGDPVARARPLAWLADWITRLLVWVAGPFVLGCAWWRSMPAHDEWLTLLIGLCFWIALTIGFTSWWRAEQRLKRIWLGPWARGMTRLAAGLVVVLVMAVSWLRTEGGLDKYFDGAWTLEDVEFTVSRETPVFSLWLDEDLVLPLARADLAGGALGAAPDDWRDHDYARRRYREGWCARRDIDLMTCETFGSENKIAIQAVRARWCESRQIAPKDCAARFGTLAADHREEWLEERRAFLSQLNSPDLTRRDLRRADLNGAFLAGANLVGARLEGANFLAARLEGANIEDTRLEGAILAATRSEGANFSGAWSEGANFWEARLEMANLVEARLEGADFWRARLEGADLVGARLVGASLQEARLEGAKLQGARLGGALLYGARLDGAELWKVDFRRSNWRGTTTHASPAQFSDFRGARALTQSQLDEFIGNEATLLPDGLSETGKPFYVWSCWETPTTTYDRINSMLRDELERAELYDAFLCGPDNPRRKTGTPLALDAPYPEGHPLADRN